MDRIIGLEIGADDYISKSCHPRELLARIRSVLRRSLPKVQAPCKITQVGDLSLDRNKCQFLWKDQALDLTQSEFQLLQYLVERSGKVVSKEELSEEVLKRSLEIFDRTLDVHISRIRHKIKAVDSKAQVIKTVRGFGFMLEGESGA
jgi:DNA-binding response OmpR family regulator